jgi:hypothetical protein
MGTEAQVKPQPRGLYLVSVTGQCDWGSLRPRLLPRLPRGVRGRRLAYSFSWEGSEVVPPDGMLLSLTHTGLPNAEQCASHAGGWAHYLGRLAEVAVGRYPGPGPLMRPHWQGAIAGP